MALDIQAFMNKFGRAPNVLLVAPNAELDLNAIGVKVNATYKGMRVVLAEIDNDYLLALTHDQS